MDMWTFTWRFASCIALAAAWVTGEARAQTCASPPLVTVNTPLWLNTCLGDQSLVVACGMFPLNGPAGVVRLPLPYPIGDLSVQSMTGGFDPALFLLHSQCSNTSSCGMAVDSGLVVDSLNLATVDSGNYFLVIAPISPGALACGWVTVTHSMTPQQQLRVLEGIFRGGISAPSANP